jgi:hypothetical protein
LNAELSARALRAIEDVRSDHELSEDLLVDVESLLIGEISEESFFRMYNMYRSIRGSKI